MNKKIKHGLFMVLLVGVAMAAQAGDYVVIVNTGNAVSDMPKAHLKRVFTGKLKEYQGVSLVPIDLPADSDVAQAFLSDVVGMSPGEYKEYWVAQQVKGGGAAPMIQKTPAMVKAMVSQIPGAISYIPAGDIDDTVKQLTIK
ncbi:MAG: hypothetical protein ACOCW2_02770 [Chitinivibrionales bacterium]